ncbi:MAG: response regulator [Myxococcales bacterium]|nr:response regulator [Myxococcales bacterium]
MSALLVVDDDPHILRTLEIMFQQDGHVVRCVRSAEQALEVLDADTFACALVDLQLPT